MASVDDRIVRMEFDNAAFERKLQTTLASLGQLDKALKFTGATKGLADVSDAASKVSFRTISDGIENVSKGFIALSTIAITALSNITSRAIQAGLQLIKSFTFGPIFEGFREFETNANSIQTILANTASKGTTLTQVTDALNLLNIYSDKTIYNFGQMARNIGTFTAAGVDLDTSVDAIKGIANLAALSGSNSEQASTAMYQLSQAIAAGAVKLMDWNSVVNAGMGGEVFKNALFETAKAMGNTLNVPVDQTFKQWEDAGNSFRESLQEGWITAEVLTTTLSTFTGDMTKEMLVQKGFNEQQADAILKTAAIATAAATEVKTFTQLMGTVKEAIGTGFADSFRIVIGNFEEAKTLFTDMNNTIGGFVGRIADARNEVLQGWKDFGGRNDLIEGLKNAFGALSFVITAVKDAFSNIFPPVTSATLIRLTASFKEFTLSLTPSAETLDKIKRIAQGVFAALSIGWEIIQEGTKFIIGLGKSLLSLVTPEATGFLAKLGDGLTALQAALVKGGGIKTYFETLTKILQKPIEFLGKIKEAIGSIFNLFNRSAANAVEDGMGRIGDRFKSLKDIFSAAGNLWEPFENALRKIVDVLDNIWDVIKDWFKDLGKKIASVMGEGEFNNVLDVINVGLLGGIALLLRKFFKEGFKFDLGGGLFEKISKSFEELTGVLSAMQTNIKANALLRIASAIAILTASVLVLSMIDSASLTKALSAMAVGFGELMASFTILSKMASTPGAAASFSIITGGLIALSTAILIMTGAVKILSKMSWEEIGKGLTAVTGLLIIMVGVSKVMGKESVNMIAAGVGITAIAIGLNILAIAMKIFATMSWEEIGKGLTAVIGSLIGIAAAMQLMPATLPITAVGLIGVAFAMTILAGAIKIFSKMSWEEIGKGMAALGGGLLIIAGAMHLMPAHLPITAAGLVLVGIALNGIAAAMKIFATMSWEEIGKGLAAMGGALLVLAVGLTAMILALPGAIALTVVAPALAALFAVLKTFGTISFGDLLKSLAKMAIVLVGLALAAALIQPAIPAILSLGIALVALGIGFALIGGGAILIGKALELVATSGAKAAKVIPELLESIGKAIPAFTTGLTKGLIEAVKVIGKSLPMFAEMIGKLVIAILDQLKLIIPKLGPVIIQLITEIFTIIRSYAPQYIATGLFILTELLKGIRDNIGPIVTLAADIITNFLSALRLEIPRIAASLADTLIVAFTETARQVGEVSATILPTVGRAFIEGFFNGVKEGWGPVGEWFLNLGGSILGFIGDVLGTLVQKGKDILQGFFNGILNIWDTLKGWFITLGDSLKGFVKDPLGMLYELGKLIIEGLWNGMKDMWKKVSGWLSSLDPTGLFNDINLPKGHAAKNMVPTGLAVMGGLQYGMQEGWKNITKWVRDLDPSEHIDNMTKIIGGVAAQLSDTEEFNPVITPVLDLTRVSAEAVKMGGVFKNFQPLTARLSLNQAKLIARHQTPTQSEPISEIAAPQGVVFEQNIYSPTQLSTSDIYKNTRNQIRIAKEELSIP